MPLPKSFGLSKGWPIGPGQAVTVAPAITLNAITATGSPVVGTLFNGTISGRTAGSTLALSGPGAAGLSINQTTGAISGTPTTAGAINIVETLAGATNSPRTSNGVLTVADGQAASFIQPYNRQYVMGPGDSHGAQSGGGSGTYGTSILAVTTMASSDSGVECLLTTYANNKVRRGNLQNMGVGGASAEDILAVPRPSDANKGLDKAAAHPAAIIVMEVGSNNRGSDSTLASSLNLMTQAIRALTDPAYVYPPSGAVLPLYQGRPKTVLLVCNFRVGVTSQGVVQNDLTEAQAISYRNYTRELLKFGYDSGDAKANPRVIAVDTFDDPTIADATSGTLYRPKAGYFADGLHFAPEAAFVAAKRLGGALDAVLDSSVNFAILPTVSTAADGFLNINPCLQAGTAGGESLNSNTRSGDPLPSSWNMLLGGSGLNVDVAVTDLGGGRGNQIRFKITGTASANATFLFQQLLQSGTAANAKKALINLATDTLRTTARIGLKINSGSPINLTITGGITNGDNAHSFQAVTGIRGNPLGYGNVAAQESDLNNPFANVQFDPQVIVTPNITLSDQGATGNPTVISNIMKMDIRGGEVTDIELTVSEFGMAKATTD